MDEQKLKLRNAPIVEAVIDIDCDMPPNLDVKELEKPARDQFQDAYPKFATRLIHEHKFQMKDDAPPETSYRHGFQALQYLHEDEKQLVQIRNQGFSFNRLTPYSSFDDYFPEIERTWRLFLELTSPVQIRCVRLRYINRLLLPSSDEQVQLNDYLVIGPRLSDDDKLSLIGFLSQQTVKEKETGNEANIVMTAQAPEAETLPIIFDITASRIQTTEPDDWESIASCLQSLRNLKNQIFRYTLTEQCLELFR